MKKIIILILTILLFKNNFGQDLINKLENYDYNKYFKIIKDSIWEFEDYRFCNDYPNINLDSTDFFIIPYCKYKENVNEYNDNNQSISIINYIEIDSFFLYAISSYKGQYIGDLYAFKFSKKIRDSLNKEDKWYPMIYYKVDFIKNPENAVENAFIFLKNKKPKYYFILPAQNAIWFIENDELKIYSYFTKQIYTEKEYIKKVKVIKKFGRNYYSIDCLIDF